MKYGLALAGGGTRGAFQAGVWRALKELGKEINVIVGTSIGAVNGAMFAMGADPSELWLKTELSDIVESADDVTSLFSAKSLISFIREGFGGGLDTMPFRRLLSRLVSEERLRASDTDFGLCTYSAEDKKTVELFLNEIPNGKLIDYILASACFPMFKPVIIDGKEYSDGGIQNNLPEDMLINHGCDTIISVSVHGIGMVRDIDRCGVNIIRISPSGGNGGLMEFDAKEIKRSIDSGYLECKRAFGELCGERFFLERKSYMNFVSEYGSEIIKGIETAAEMIGLDECRIYTAEELAENVIQDCGKNKRLNGMIEIIKNGRSRFMREKLDIMKNTFFAANSVVYLEQNMKK